MYLSSREMKEFYKKTLKQIRWWAWAAAVLPLLTLAGLFFVKFIGTDSNYTLALTTGATIMFGVAVVWWWWAIYTIAKITDVLSGTLDKFDDVDTDIKELRKELKKELSKLFK